LPPPSKAGHKQNAQRQNDLILAAAEKGDEHQRQQDAGKGGDAVIEAHEYLVHPAPVIAGQPADEDPRCQADGHSGGGDDKGGTCPLHHTGEDIPPEVIGAQDMLETGGGHPRRAIHPIGVIGRPERPDQDDQQHKARDDHARSEIFISSVYHSKKLNLFPQGDRVLFTFRKTYYPSRTRGSMYWVTISAR
jgi:hypothetical protein